MSRLHNKENLSLFSVEFEVNAVPDQYAYSLHSLLLSARRPDDVATAERIYSNQILVVKTTDHV